MIYCNMTKPIEILHGNFDKKICTLQSIFTILKDVECPECDIEAEFNSANSEYNDNVINILCDYYVALDMDTKCKMVERYDDFIVSRNFVSKFDSVSATLKELCKRKNIERSDEITALLRRYNDIPVDMEVKKYDYKTCPECSSKMTVYPHQSEIRCGGCAFTILLKGTVFDETQFYSQEGSIAKRGSYETSRHCRYHLERILAIKNPNLPPGFVSKAQEWLTENNVNAKNMSCEDWRGCLKYIKKTKYNEHIPFIRQYFGGSSPGRLYHHEQQQLYIDFDKAVQEFERIKNGENNLKYYPYFILKILQKNISRKEDRNRLQSIVDCIHLQRDNTVVNNDRIWKRICEGIPGWEFQKTDKNLLYSL